RLIVAERGRAGSIAAFPPPHNFFWARESDQNLGYSWYRKDSSTSLGAGETFAFGIRQPEGEERENIRGNFALYSARPGTMQHMPEAVLTQHEYQIEGAKRHSDKDFLVMPDHEFYGSVLGGHTDMLFSHPVYWLYGRANSKPLVEQHPKYGKVYNIGSPEDLM